MRLFLLLFSFFLLASCHSDGHFATEIEKVDSLYTQVLTLETRIKEIDSNKAKEVFHESNELEKYLSENYPDSLDKNFWVNDMNRIYKVRRGLEKYLSKESALKEEIKYSKRQLLSLKKSLQDEKVDSIKAGEYLVSEQKALEKISFFMNKLQPKGIEAIQTWPEVKQDLQLIADSIAKL